MKECYLAARIPVLALAMGAWLVASDPAFAARLVTFVVSIDGQVVLRTSTGDEGADADAVWRYLNRLELEPVKEYKVEADRDDPLRATLKGQVIIESQEGGQAEVAELKLVREKADARWQVAPREVDRTFQSRNKPLHLTVSIDGKTVLLNATSWPWAIGADTDAVWRNLRRVELRSFQQYKVQAGPEDPLRATLKGQAVIQAGHAGQAEVSELKLVREKVNAPWKIDPTEIERTFQSRTKPK